MFPRSSWCRRTFYGLISICSTQSRRQPKQTHNNVRNEPATFFPAVRYPNDAYNFYLEHCLRRYLTAFKIVFACACRNCTAASRSEILSWVSTKSKTMQQKGCEKNACFATKCNALETFDGARCENPEPWVWTLWLWHCLTRRRQRKKCFIVP